MINGFVQTWIVLYYSSGLWRLGIPVLKLEPTTHYRFAKYLWSPHVLSLSRGPRLPMDSVMQRERMDFILGNNIVYIEEDPNFFQSQAAKFKGLVSKPQIDNIQKHKLVSSSVPSSKKKKAHGTRY